MPGASAVTYRYDKADKLIFSQDGNQKAKARCTFYLYDKQGRLCVQGECAGSSMGQEANVVVTAARVSTGTGLAGSGYSANINPASPAVYIINYYDDYSFRSITGFNDGSFPDKTVSAQGLLTASSIAALGSSEVLRSAYYYDSKGQLVKTVSKNLRGQTETRTTAYTFTGKPLRTTHTCLKGGTTELSEQYDYTYDNLERLTKVEHTLNGKKVTLAADTYNKHNLLSAKALHGAAANKLTYRYNTRSWLTEVAHTNFTQNLYYADGSNPVKCYNGNISSMTWKAADNVIRGYKFSYDNLNRMLNAAYGEAANLSTNLNAYTEKVTAYDKNGNILGLQRYGKTSATACGLIGNLSMTLNGNQLNRVEDAVTASAYNGGFEFKNSASAAGEYAYDANGNLIKDLNKSITNIEYNFLNLPGKVTFSDGSTISYLYSADGKKLRTVHKIGSTTTTTDYCDNVVYENGVAKLLLTEEGYVSLNDKKYHYYLKDHQGNNRAVVNESGTSEETNHYYPFGGVFASTGNVQAYKYNGKELDAKKGLNWYDYGAREYDAALGRFTTMDPMAEKYFSMSSFTYCANNPIKYIDTDGRKIVDVNGNIIYTTNGGWAHNAPQDAIRIGNAMMQTRTGSMQFKKMNEVDYNITLNISSKSEVKKGDGKTRYRLGTSKMHFEGKKLKSVDIVIFEGTINEYITANTPKAKKYRSSTKNNNEVIGVIAVHESVHATDEQNIKDSKENIEESTSHDIEKTPVEAEMNALRELFNQHNQF